MTQALAFGQIDPHLPRPLKDCQLEGTE